MGTIATVTVTCWLCALIAMPRKPLVPDEVAALVYRRLLGRQQWLALLAGALSAVLLLAIVLSLPQRMESEHSAAPTTGVTATCNDEMACPWMFEQH